MWFLYGGGFEGEEWKTNNSPQYYNPNASVGEVLEKLLQQKMYCRAGILLAGLMSDAERVACAVYLAEESFLSDACNFIETADGARQYLDAIKDWLAKPEYSEEAGETFKELAMATFKLKGFNNVWTALRVARYTAAGESRKTAVRTLGEMIGNWIAHDNKRTEVIIEQFFKGEEDGEDLEAQSAAGPAGIG